MDSLIKDILSYHVICNVIIPHHAITSDGGAASQWPHTHASYLSLCWLAFLIQTTDGIIIIRSDQLTSSLALTDAAYIVFGDAIVIQTII